ncbi:putative malate dehydrogenase 1B isoform X2 [Aethina tumida]|nr:putative malate dehydrogenase 1B isoform X2 [Aethina tumida]XP_049822196.1 putative malate dehydrogenase 1B isoform X2 [Aethina tumida]
MDLNNENGWNFVESPVIWKELISGGKKHKIGGLSEFWEYCYDYYGLVSHASSDTVQKMINENLLMYERERKVFADVPGRMVVSFCGANSSLTETLIYELLKLKAIIPREGIEIRLQDDNMSDFGVREKMESLASSFNQLALFGSKPFIKTVDHLDGAINDCDLLITFVNFKNTRYKKETDELRVVWLEAERFADVLNKWGKRTMRVLLCNYNCPNNIFANFLIEMATAIKIKNVVVPMAFYGLKYLNAVSKRTGVSIDQMAAPPVWGGKVAGVYVDIRSTIYKAYVCMPNKRSLTAPENSCLSFGKVVAELRYLSHMIANEEELQKEVEQNTNKHEGNFGKIRAIMDLLRIWYENDHEPVFSLGSCSNGTFGLPKGIVISQPVSLVNDTFVPCKEYPVPERTLKIIKNIGEKMRDILNRYKEIAIEYLEAKRIYSEKSILERNKKTDFQI